MRWYRSVTEAGLVDLAVEAHAGEPTDDRAHQRHHGRGNDRDDPRHGDVALAYRDPRKAVETAQHVVLAAEHRRGHSDDDSDDDRPYPHRDALFRTVKPGHPPGDVA